MWISTIFRKAASMFTAWRRRRRWTAEMQLEHLRVLVLQDHRWLAGSKVADALSERYLAALAPDWYARQHEDVSQLRRRLGLDPHARRQGYSGAIEAAVVFLQNDAARNLLGLHAIRVNGEMMDRAELAALLQTELVRLRSSQG